jgi:hypothetical protein
MSTLKDFAAELTNSNIARPYLYYVDIALPPALVGKIDQRIVSLFCAGAATPQLNFYTNDNYNEAGIKRRVIYDYDYQDLMLQFYVDQNYTVQKFFDIWKEAIVDSRRNFNYPEEYTAESIDVHLIDMQGTVKHSYSFKNIYPKIINSVSLGYGMNGISVLPISFVFETVTTSAEKILPNMVDITIEAKRVGALGNPEILQTYNAQSIMGENTNGLW